MRRAFSGLASIEATVATSVPGTREILDPDEVLLQLSDALNDGAHDFLSIRSRAVKAHLSVRIASAFMLLCRSSFW